MTFIKGINQFTDLSDHELEVRFAKSALRKPYKINVKKTEAIRFYSKSLPEYVNWYEAGKVSESVDQTGCGACWAFTTATTLESLNAIQNNLPSVPMYSV